MQYNELAGVFLLPTDQIDKNVFFQTGTLTIPAGGAGSEGIFRISHNLGKALLPEAMFQDLANNTFIPPNQESVVVYHLACDASDIIISYYKNANISGNVSYWVRLIDYDT